MDAARRELERFDAALPIEEAWTPPPSWYTDAAFFELERRTVFRRSWQAVARDDQVSRPGDVLSGILAGEPWLVARDEEGVLRAFANVCRHHAAEVLTAAANVRELVCPYHGWTYALDGRLRRAPHMGGSRRLDPETLSLRPWGCMPWGPLVLVRPAGPDAAPPAELQKVLGRLDASDMRWVARRTYTMQCNWKVFVDNYLDGGYHVAALHPDLASGLDLESYTTTVGDRVVIQSCRAKGADRRLGAAAVYVWVHPNLMLNRYGPVLDTQVVLPLAPDRCAVVFDWWFTSADDEAFVNASLEASHRVQLEDQAISESVQRGLGSSAAVPGPYAPRLEGGAHRFHRLLHADLRS